LKNTQKLFKKGRKEKTMLVIYFAMAFVVFFAMIIWIASSMINSSTLKMKTEAERSFNSVYMTLLDNPSQTQVTMHEEQVYNIGIYTTTGKLIKSIGNAPSILPATLFNKVGGDSSDGVYFYDSETKTIQYIRLARMNFHFNAGAFFSDNSSDWEVPQDLPEVLYVSFDGTDYQKELTRIRVISIAFIIFILLFFLAIANIYRKNQEYQEILQKQKSLVSLGTAARTLTHEIKNPLSALTIQIALMKKTCTPDYYDDLKIMEGEIKRLTLLTNKVSEFLRNPLGNPEKIEIRSFLENICSIFPSEINFTKDSLKNGYISFDIDRARSVFENLIKNASESCSGRDPKITISLKEEKGFIIIKVMDRGDGLKKDVAKDQYFDPFYTTKIKGSGIGLAISRQFVNARGGSIQLYNRDGGGTIVQVMLASVKSSKKDGMKNESTNS